jgi:hypothetical protein
VARLLVLCPKKEGQEGGFLPEEVEHLPSTYHSALARFANRQRLKGFKEKGIDGPRLQATNPYGKPHPGYPIIFANAADNVKDPYYKAFVEGDPYKNSQEFWDSCKLVSVSQIHFILGKTQLSSNTNFPKYHVIFPMF